LAAKYVGGVWAKDYIAEAGSQLVATENASGGLGTTCSYAMDHLGSVRLVMGRHDYLPYGEEIAASTVGRDANFAKTPDVTQRATGRSGIWSRVRIISMRGISRRRWEGRGCYM
jgi:hypothetical protein